MHGWGNTFNISFQIFTAKKIEIESGKAKTTVFKKRGTTLSSITAALKEEPESSDDEGESSKKFGDGPLWQLFDHLFNAASASGELSFSPSRILATHCWLY